MFRELRSTGNYFQGFGEQAHSFGDLWSSGKKLIINKKKSHLKGKAFIFFKFFFGLDPPLGNLNVFII